jgi:hypothetical protein
MRLPGVSPEQWQRYKPFAAILGGALLAGILLLVVRSALNDRARGQVRALHWVARHRVLLAEETARDADGQGGDDAVLHLASIDARTGHRLGRVYASLQTSFIGASSRGLWVRDPEGEGIHRLDAKTLEESASEEDWRDKYTSLGEPRKVEAPLDPRFGIPIRFAGGKRQWLDGDSLDVRPDRGEPLGNWASQPSVDLSDTVRGTAPVVRIGRLHGVAELDDAGPRRKAVACTGQHVSETGFIEPVFLAQGADTTGMLLDGPDFLLVHRPAETASAGIALSRVDCSGERKWTALLGDGRVAGALQAEGNQVFLVVRGNAGYDRVMAVDDSKGEVLWTYRTGGR